MLKTFLATAMIGATALVAGEALASGACVYVTLDRGQKTVVCEKVGASSVCDRKGINGGTYHDGKACSDVDYAVAPGPAKRGLDAIPSPLKPTPRKPTQVHPEHTDHWKHEGKRKR